VDRYEGISFEALDLDICASVLENAMTDPQTMFSSTV
jgi:hypothetical protein